MLSRERKKMKSREKRKEKVKTEEELKKIREANAERKPKSHKNQCPQKKSGTKRKDRNRKRQENEKEANICESTVCVKKYRQNFIKINSDFLHAKRNKRARINDLSSAISKSLNVMSPTSKLKTMKASCVKSMSPSSQLKLAENISLIGGPASSEMAMFKSLSKKGDKFTNCTRRLLLNKALSKSSRKNLNHNLNVSWTSLIKAQNDIEKIIIHYKTDKSKTKPPPATVRKVHDFYNKDTTSRQLPYKNLTRKVKDYEGVYHRVPVQVMEVMLSKLRHTCCSNKRTQQ